MFLEYKYTFPPVEPTKVVAQATPTTGCPGIPWERTLEQLHIVWEADLIHKHKMFCLIGWYSIQVNRWLHPMQLSSMGRHGPGHQLHPVVRAWYVLLEILPVSGPLSYDPPTERLL